MVKVNKGVKIKVWFIFINFVNWIGIKEKIQIPHGKIIIEGTWRSVKFDMKFGPYLSRFPQIPKSYQLPKVGKESCFKKGAFMQCFSTISRVFQVYLAAALRTEWSSYIHFSVSYFTTWKHTCIYIETVANSLYSALH